MSKSKERARVEHVITSAFYAIDSAVNRACRYDATRIDEQNRRAYKLQSLWSDLYAECERQEREHRALGKRLGQSLRGRTSVHLVACYFAARAVTREVPEVGSWFTANDVRRDWALGYAIGEVFNDLGLWREVIKRIGSISPLADIDYSKDLV